MKLFVSVGIAACLLSGCSALNDMGSMKDTTAHMDQTTTHMDTTTSDMDTKTAAMQQKMDESTAAVKESETDVQKSNEMQSQMLSNMKVSTESVKTSTTAVQESTTAVKESLADVQKSNEMQKYIYSDNRQSAAMQDREIAGRAMDKMITSETMLDKFSWAGTYFDAFEFQIWKNAPVVGDTKEKREMMEADAVQEFFNEINGQIKDYSRFSPITPEPKKDNAYRDLMALAGAMGQLNTNQVLAGETNGFTPVSFEDILEYGLSQLPAINEGTLNPIPPQVAQVDDVEPQAVYMINLRHNVILGCTLSQMAGIDMDNLMSKDQFKNFKSLAGSLLTTRAVDVTYLNVARLNQIISYLDEVKRVRTFLLQHGLPIERSLLARLAPKVIRATVTPSKFAANVTQQEKDEKASKVKAINDDLQAVDALVSPNETVHDD